MELEGLEREPGFRATLSAGMISRKQPKRDVSGQFVLQQQGSPKSRVLKTMDFFFLLPLASQLMQVGKGMLFFRSDLGTQLLGQPPSPLLPRGT